jgi:DNA-binding phage protein
MRRVFVQVSEDEWEFLTSLRGLIKRKRGLTKPPSVSGVVTGILRDYRHILEESSSPDVVDAYKLATRKKYSVISG